MTINMENTKQLRAKSSAIAISILFAMMFASILCLQKIHRTAPVTIPAIEHKWGTDSTWRKNWDV